MITPTQLARLILDEEKRLTVYDDATGIDIGPGSHVIGHPTIGTGRAIDQSNGISDDENDILLMNDIEPIWRALAVYPWWTRLNSDRQYVIGNMCFNVGIAGVCGPHGFPRMIAALTRNDYPAAAKEMQSSHWAKQVPARANRLVCIMLSG